MKTLSETREMVACARINLENLARSVPGLDKHPYYKIVQYQLRCAEVEDDSTVPVLIAPEPTAHLKGKWHLLVL